MPYRERGPVQLYFHKAACSLIGIRPATLQDWLNVGRRDMANGNTSTREAAVFVAVEWA